MSPWLIASLVVAALVVVLYVRWGSKQPPLSDEDLAERHW